MSLSSTLLSAAPPHPIYPPSTALFPGSLMRPHQAHVHQASASPSRTPSVLSPRSPPPPLSFLWLTYNGTGLIFARIWQEVKK